MRFRQLMVFCCVFSLIGCGTNQPTAAVTTAVPPTTAPTAAPPTTAPTVPPATLAPSATPPPTPTAVPTAEPTAVPPTAPPEAAPPQRLKIDVIGLDLPITAVGLDANRVPIVPDHDIGWYIYSAKPGEGENIVLWGHVLRFRQAPNKPAPFEQLKNLAVGTAINLTDETGTIHRYVITEQLRVKPNDVQYILPRGREMLTMVSCIGDQVINNGAVVDMTQRLITIAEPRD